MAVAALSRYAKKAHNPVSGSIETTPPDLIVSFFILKGNYMNLYFIMNPDTKLFKIGITDDIPRRLNQIQNATGCYVNLIAYALGGEKESIIKSAESMCLSLFGEGRVYGEWAKDTGEESFVYIIKDVFDILEKTGCTVSFDYNIFQIANEMRG